MLYPNNIEKEEKKEKLKEIKDTIKIIFKYIIYDRNNFRKRIIAKFNI